MLHGWLDWCADGVWRRLSGRGKRPRAFSGLVCCVDGKSGACRERVSVCVCVRVRIVISCELTERRCVERAERRTFEFEHQTCGARL